MQGQRVLAFEPRSACPQSSALLTTPFLDLPLFLDQAGGAPGVLGSTLVVG